MRQLVYISTAVGSGVMIDLAGILAASRRNNGREGVTGALWFDGKRFLQALEGPQDAVDATFRRIQGDPRHRSIVILSSRQIDTREFGEWAMASREAGDEGEAAVTRIQQLTAGASAEVRATFEGFAHIRRAA